VAASVALGLSPAQTANALALAIPQAGGVQRAFGTDGKALQVGLATDAGVRAARLAAAGASADLTAVDQWLALLGGDPAAVDVTGPAVPGGLAIKLYPCCYALQRPISALRGVTGEFDRIRVRTPAASTQPLIHHRPTTGLQGKFSMEYAIAAALLDGRPGFASFTDAAVRRPEAQRLISVVELDITDGGDGLLTGAVEIDLGTRTVTEALPPGAPGRPPTDDELAGKLADCGLSSTVDWSSARALLSEEVS
jgi:2-methylcitrate dehydratase PrpD